MIHSQGQLLPLDQLTGNASFAQLWIPRDEIPPLFTQLPSSHDSLLVLSEQAGGLSATPDDGFHVEKGDYWICTPDQSDLQERTRDLFAKSQDHRLRLVPSTSFRPDQHTLALAIAPGLNTGSNGRLLVYSATSSVHPVQSVGLDLTTKAFPEMHKQSASSFHIGLWNGPLGQGLLVERNNADQLVLDLESFEHDACSVQFSTVPLLQMRSGLIGAVNAQLVQLIEESHYEKIETVEETDNDVPVVGSAQGSPRSTQLNEVEDEHVQDDEKPAIPCSPKETPRQSTHLVRRSMSLILRPFWFFLSVLKSFWNKTWAWFGQLGLGGFSKRDSRRSPCAKDNQKVDEKTPLIEKVSAQTTGFVCNEAE